MKVTDVPIRPVRAVSEGRTPRNGGRAASQDGATLAYATVELDGQLRLRNLRLREDWRGLTVSFPDMVSRDGKRRGQWFHPTDPGLRAEIENAVAAAFREGMAR